MAANPQAAQADLIDVVSKYNGGYAGRRRIVVQQKLRRLSWTVRRRGWPRRQIRPPKKPVAFPNPAYIFEMRSDVLYAEIQRGGMGTDIPNFGTLFIQDETWALGECLWTLPAAAPSEAK